jgi:hypothetical protein
MNNIDFKFYLEDEKLKKHYSRWGKSNYQDVFPPAEKEKNILFWILFALFVLIFCR